jgi:hypothetical protein
MCLILDQNESPALGSSLNGSGLIAVHAEKTGPSRLLKKALAVG